MVNRILIRLKIVQLVYAFYLNGNTDLEKAVKELHFSLSKAYELYNYLLLLMVAVTRYAVEKVVKKEKMNLVTHQDEELNHKFIDNRFIIQLEQNESLKEYVETNHLNWEVNADYLKYLYEQIVESDMYKEYMASKGSSYQEDRELWRKIYKNIIAKDERIDELLEEKSLYWNDDRTTVDTFVLKTIKRFDEKEKSEQELLPDFKDEEDRDYAERLFRNSILKEEDYRTLIRQNVKNWEFDRLAFMDVVIMQVALAELMTFPNIPLSVTINEYVEIAKCYSTPKSGSYVNGIIDVIAKKLQRENKIFKV